MRIITKAELVEIVRKHGLWLSGEGGERADLSEADLSEADLSNANLHKADLSEADLSEADLSGADLSGANLRDANLRGANLRDANLRGAYLRGANLILVGQDIRGHLFWAYQNQVGVVVIRAGCHMFIGISAAVAHWTAAHTKDEILHADCLSLVARCETMAKIRGWKLEAE